ncbi:MAG TPA: hypothetical protein VJN02_04920 [Gammaproteobacteria bacterium]|nr:hypothetical protein [Gammaproteobacteria bacterium]
MTVIKKYMGNTYCFSHQALITKIGKDAKGTFLCLNETIFHPQGGAQPADTGTINGKKVTGLAHVGEEIYHYLEEGTECQVNDSVELLVDKANRLRNAALHSTGHIMAAILRTKYEFKRQTGANHFPDQASVKFTIDASRIPAGNELEKDVGTVIAEHRQLNIVQIEGERCLAIEGLDTGLRCGGTHLTSADEVDNFRIRNVKVDSKKREVSFGYECTHRFLSQPKIPTDTATIDTSIRIAL